MPLRSLGGVDGTRGALPEADCARARTATASVTRAVRADCITVIAGRVGDTCCSPITASVMTAITTNATRRSTLRRFEARGVVVTLRGPARPCPVRNGWGHGDGALGGELGEPCDAPASPGRCTLAARICKISFNSRMAPPGTSNIPCTIPSSMSLSFACPIAV
jgi:hypothetical protein